MDERIQGRLALNEASYRQVNEAIEKGAGDQETVAFLCECARMGCNLRLELTVDEYEAVRANGRRFFIVDGHEVPEVEQVVERHDRYTVIEKLERSGRIADATDPRGD